MQMLIIVAIFKKNWISFESNWKEWKQKIWSASIDCNSLTFNRISLNCTPLNSSRNALSTIFWGRLDLIETLAANRSRRRRAPRWPMSAHRRGFTADDLIWFYFTEYQSCREFQELSINIKIVRVNFNWIALNWV